MKEIFRTAFQLAPVFIGLGSNSRVQLGTGQTLQEGRPLFFGPLEEPSKISLGKKDAANKLAVGEAGKFGYELFGIANSLGEGKTLGVEDLVDR